MAYVKNYDPWIDGAACCTPAPGAQVWNAAAANHIEQGIFDAAADADAAQADATQALADAASAQADVDALTAPRLGVYALGMTGGTADYGTTINAPGISQRTLANVPVDTTRWRIHVRNFNASDGTAGVGTVNCNGVWFGTHPTGAPASLTQVVNAFVLSDGTEFVSPWITDAATQFKQGELGLVSLGISSTSVTPTLKRGLAGVMTTTDAGTAGTANPTLFGSYQQFFDWWVEYETVAQVSRVLVIGDSIPQGYRDATTNSSHRSWQAWPNLHGARGGGIVANGAIGGSQFTNFTGTQPVFTRWNTGSGFTWDVAVIALGSNDINASVALGTLQARLGTTVAAVRTSFAPKRIYVVPVLPRNFGATPEGVRDSYNAWLLENASALNSGAANVQVHPLLTHEVMGDPANSDILRAVDTSDGIHLTNSGQMRLVNSLPARF